MPFDDGYSYPYYLLVAINPPSAFKPSSMDLSPSSNLSSYLPPSLFLSVPYLPNDYNCSLLCSYYTLPLDSARPDYYYPSIYFLSANTSRFKLATSSSPLRTDDPPALKLYRCCAMAPLGCAALPLGGTEDCAFAFL